MNTPNQNVENFDWVDDGTGCKEIYADGVGGLILGPAVTKVTLFNVEALSDAGREQRRRTNTLVIPTAALAEFSRMFLGALGRNETGIDKALTQLRARLMGVPAPAAEGKK